MRWRRQPEAPEGVRAVLADGTGIPLEVVYRGTEDGMHVWETTGRIRLEEGFELFIDRLPARTAVRLRNQR